MANPRIHSYSTTITVKLPTEVLDEIISNYIDPHDDPQSSKHDEPRISKQSIAKIYHALTNDEFAPIAVPSALVEYFKTWVRYGKEWERPFLVNTQTTVFDLALEIQQATGVKLESQQLLVTDRHGTSRCVFEAER